MNKSYNGVKTRKYFYFSGSPPFRPIICEGLLWVKKIILLTSTSFLLFSMFLLPPTCTMKKSQMTLATRMFIFDKSKKQLRLSLDSRVIFYALKYGWNVFLKATKCFFFNEELHVLIAQLRNLPAEQCLQTFHFEQILLCVRAYS